MKIEKQEEIKSQTEILVELSQEEFLPHINRASELISKSVKIDGFRAGKIPYDVLKQKVGEMAILEEAAHLAIRKTIDKALLELGEGRLIGQPKVDIIKLAPGNPLEYKIQVALIPEITLSTYKDLGLKKNEAKVEEADIERTLSELQEMRASEMLVDREAKEGDKVLLNVSMYQDNVPLEDGQARGTAIIIGQNNLIPGFDKQIVGLKKGDKKTFSLPYPDDHYMKNIAGKMVEFRVEVLDAYERIVPELADEFAVSFGLKNLEEMKNNIRKGIEAEKEQEADRKTEKELLEKLLEKTKFGDIPEMLVDQESRNMLSELKQGISEKGGKFEDYLTSIKKTEAELTVDMMPDAMKRVKASLLIREIAKKEEIKVSKEEVDHHLEHMQSHYQGQDKILEQIRSQEYRNYVANVETSRKVVAKLMEWNVSK